MAHHFSSRKSALMLDMRDFFGDNCLRSLFIDRRSQRHRCQAGRERCYPDALMRMGSCSQESMPPPPILSFKLAEHPEQSALASVVLLWRGRWGDSDC